MRRDARSKTSRRRSLRPQILLALTAFGAAGLLVGCGVLTGGASSLGSVAMLWLLGLSLVGFLVGCSGGGNSDLNFNSDTAVQAQQGGGGAVTPTPTPAPPFGPPVKVGFLNQPSKLVAPKTEALTPITPAPQVAILDAQGRIVTTATNEVTISLGSNPNGAVLLGTLKKNAVNGIATFDDLMISKAAGGFSLAASAAGLQGSSTASFVVQPLPPVFATGASRVDVPNGIDASDGVNSAVVGDFNKDGKVDVALASYGGTVSLLLGDGNGGFAPPRIVRQATRTYTTMAAGDFNGDGNLDLVVADYLGNQASVMLGRGDGTFQSAVNYAVAGPAAVVTGDFNGDGKVDIAVAQYKSVTPATFFMGVGDGTFGAGVPVGTGGNAFGIAAGRVDGDAIDDVVLVIQGDAQVVLGGSTPTPLAKFNISGQRLTAPSLADLNADGKLDLVTADNGHVWSLLGNGDGTFQTARDNPAAGATVASVGDVNGDGHPDAIATLSNGQVGVMAGDGTGAFGAPTPYPVARANGVVEAAPLAVDLNGDGQLDVVGSCGPVESVLVNLGGGVFAKPPTQATIPLPHWIALADADGDTKPDLLTVNEAGTFAFQKGNGDGTFQASINATVPLDAEQFAIGDLNKDGHLDAVVAHSGGTTVDVLLGDGTGHFTVTQVDAGGAQSGVALGDVNGDGNLDIAFTSPATNVSVMLGNGDGTFQAPRVAGAVTSNSTPTLADVNADGRLDVVAADGSDVSVLLGNGDGTFQAALKSPSTGAGPVLVGDYNLDGRLDAAVPYGASVNILLGNGDGLFKAAVVNAAAVDTNNGVVVDFNLDGIPDLVLSSPSFSDAVVLQSNGDGTFAAPVAAGTTMPCSNPAVADLNADGKPDVVTGDQLAKTMTNTVTVNLHK